MATDQRLGPFSRSPRVQRNGVRASVRPSEGHDACSLVDVCNGMNWKPGSENFGVGLDCHGDLSIAPAREVFQTPLAQALCTVRVYGVCALTAEDNGRRLFVPRKSVYREKHLVRSFSSRSPISNRKVAPMVIKKGWIRVIAQRNEYSGEMEPVTREQDLTGEELQTQFLKRKQRRKPR